MSARAIIGAAYRAGIVPEHLHGKTQYKTLQARLSEEIIYNKRNAVFYRTEPGRFFLSEFISDPTIPESHKVPFPARRRTRDILKEPSLAIAMSYVNSRTISQFDAWRDLANDAQHYDALRYVDPKPDTLEYATVWHFSLVRRANSLLSYRIGRYRDDRDGFANRRTIGFPGIVRPTDNTLFSNGDYGVAAAALDALLLDLDLSLRAFKGDGAPELPKSTDIMVLDKLGRRPTILLVLQWQCPSWFEPTTRRLSLNDVSWLDLSSRINNIDDFEPWSRAALERILY